MSPPRVSQARPLVALMVGGNGEPAGLSSVIDVIPGCPGFHPADPRGSPELLTPTRPDWARGDAAARVLRRTLLRRIGPLTDDVVLLPGHYARGRLEGPLTPTLGAVRRTVPLLELEEEEFVDRLLSGMPPRPKNYLKIIASNMGEELPELACLEIGGNSCAADSRWAA